MNESVIEITQLPEKDDVHAWLAAQMNSNRPTLLAFADDGVIWGRWDGKTLSTAHQVDNSLPDLRCVTLLQAFVFGKDDEVRLFHDELGNWKAWQIKDAGEVILESQILWGDKPAKAQPGQGFLRVQVDRKGIPDQLVPVDGTLDKGKCLRLDVHHLVVYEETGEARIALSRLAGLWIGNKAEEV